VGGQPNLSALLRLEIARAPEPVWTGAEILATTQRARIPKKLAKNRFYDIKQLRKNPVLHHRDSVPGPSSPYRVAISTTLRQPTIQRKVGCLDVMQQPMFHTTPVPACLSVGTLIRLLKLCIFQPLIIPLSTIYLKPVKSRLKL
jgi:hypothetical protein